MTARISTRLGRRLSNRRGENSHGLTGVADKSDAQPCIQGMLSGVTKGCCPDLCVDSRNDGFSLRVSSSAHKSNNAKCKIEDEQIRADNGDDRDGNERPRRRIVNTPKKCIHRKPGNGVIHPDDFGQAGRLTARGDINQEHLRRREWAKGRNVRHPEQEGNATDRR